MITFFIIPKTKLDNLRISLSRATQKCALCAHYKTVHFFHTAKFARVKANITQSQNKYCLRNNLSIISTPKSIPWKQPPFTVVGP